MSSSGTHPVQRIESRRKYELKERAEGQARTRARIVKATLELHETVGPARTNVSEIARRAGVERRTIYNHFPDEHELFEACGALWVAERPLPNPTSWQDIDDPQARTRAALTAIYSYYAVNGNELGPVLRDSLAIPPLRDVLDHGLLGYLAGIGEDLVRAWRRRGHVRARVAAVIAVALDFGSWRRLTAPGGLAGDSAAALMAQLIRAAGEL
jgi:AcrR family transcriptional regulator